MSNDSSQTYLVLLNIKIQAYDCPIMLNTYSKLAMLAHIVHMKYCTYNAIYASYMSLMQWWLREFYQVTAWVALKVIKKEQVLYLHDIYNIYLIKQVSAL